MTSEIDGAGAIGVVPVGIEPVDNAASLVRAAVDDHAFDRPRLDQTLATPGTDRPVMVVGPSRESATHKRRLAQHLARRICALSVGSILAAANAAMRRRVMARQAVTLGDLVGRIEHLEVCCTRCPRHGRVRLAKLIAEHGVDMGLPDLAVRLAADCPKAQATSPADRCFVTFPQLLDLPERATSA